MLTGKSINVGRMIHREICAYAARKSEALFFPSLITRMCRNARAPYLVNEEKLHNTGEIDAIAVARTAQERPVEPSHRPSSSRLAAASSSNTTTNSPIAAAILGICKGTGQCLKEVPEKNFTKPISIFPAFPEEILQDLDDEHMAESDEDGSSGTAA
ncbi:hypothetical protein PanWU01x14_327200 [Parasponia andersonii]|uniref:Uncharacterized protein n=1 Tax=Parasponia andersonii TaxID=3476 RepID=A0A2P5AJ42_PARAD|nr:hypothetical protein PanWU01x14_327200 [Parasponia andersonii]